MTHQAAPAFPARLASMNLAAHIKHLNGATGKGGYFICVRLDREFNEIVITLANDHAVLDSYYIDRGHTPADKLAALDDLYATAARMLGF